LSGNKIAKNTYVNDICVGSLTKEEAKKILEKNVSLETIELVYSDKKWEVQPSEIDAKYNFDKTVEQAYQSNRSSSIFDNLTKTIKINFGTKNILTMTVDYDKEKLKEKLEEIKKDVDIDVENATLEINGNNISVSKDSKGLEVDVEESLKNIEAQIQGGSISNDLVVKEVNPRITKDDLDSVDTILGRYTTQIKASSAGRISNIKNAAQKMNNNLMMPGDEFSYATVTGPYTRANGYQNAPVIVEGEMQSGIGGGVCQLSSTMYNSVLYAGLEIVQLKNHSIPSTYVPKGRDATVTDSGIDFVFKNNLSEPIYLKSYVTGSTIVTEIYGSSKDKQNIEIQTNTDGVSSAPIKKVDDPTIEKGKEKILEKGRDAYTVSTYRVYKDSKGNVIEKEKIYTSYYPKKQTVIAVGTKEIKEEKPKPDTSEPKPEENKPKPDTSEPKPEENKPKPDANEQKPEENKPKPDSDKDKTEEKPE
ncbi:MAG: VanW family protein, partial [Peptostreptococcaceae bacterium]